MSDSEHTVVHDTDSEVDWRQMAGFMRQMLVTLDGLWFMNVYKNYGPEKTLELDIDVMIGQFKLATRLWRQMLGLDGESRADKARIFQAMAHLYGHEFQVLDEPDSVTMRLTKCEFYENIKRAGRADSHDCRILCTKMAPKWFAEIEPRTGGEGEVDLQLPQGGTHCDWRCKQPE